MSWHPLLDLAGALAGRRDGERKPGSILVIRRNRMGDMICTLPLLHALRRHFPDAHLAVACDAPGLPIAQACPAVNEAILLKPGGNILKQAEAARKSQLFECVVAAKGGFDRRLAGLVRLSRAPVRIGFAGPNDAATDYYSNPVALPPRGEHQVETLLRLAEPLGVRELGPPCYDLELPKAALDFVAKRLGEPPFAEAERLVLINISSTVPVRFGDDDFVELAKRLAALGDVAVGFISAPADQARAQALAARAESAGVTAVATLGPLELAALLMRATVLVTPEGGAAHLATVTDTAAAVLWSEGPLEKWRSRGENHRFVRAETGETRVPVERVWGELQQLLQKQGGRR